MDMNLTSHRHLLPRLRMTGATIVLPPYALMEYTGENMGLPLTFIIQNRRLVYMNVLKGMIITDPFYR
jgi:hypothetical protein